MPAILEFQGMQKLLSYFVLAVILLSQTALSPAEALSPEGPPFDVKGYVVFSIGPEDGAAYYQGVVLDQKRGRYQFQTRSLWLLFPCDKPDLMVSLYAYRENGERIGSANQPVEVSISDGGCFPATPDEP